MSARRADRDQGNLLGASDVQWGIRLERSGSECKKPRCHHLPRDTTEWRHLAGQGHAQSWQNAPKCREVPQRERCPAQSYPGSPLSATHLLLLPAAFSPGTDGATSAPARPRLRSTPPALPLPASASEICQRSEDQSPPMHAGAACLRTRIATKGTAALQSAPLNPVPSTVASSSSWSTSYIPAQASWHTVAVWIQPEPPARPPGQP